jgi:hypothetical protein
MTPQVIILDIAESVAALEKELAPHAKIIELPAREAIEILWPGFHDRTQMDAYIPDMVQAALESSAIPVDNDEVSNLLYDALNNFALDLAYRLNTNGLYDTTTEQLPHSWNWMPDGRVYLKYDPGIDKMLNDEDS